MFRNKIFLTILPFLVIGSMYIVFRGFTNKFGLKAGYFTGYVFYWTFWCIYFPLVILKGKEVLTILKPTGLSAVLIPFVLIPPVLALIFGPFLQYFLLSNFIIIIISIILAFINAFLEEVLWRGVYASIFGNSFFFSVIVSSIGYGIWKHIPLFFNPSPIGNIVFVMSAILFGMSFGVIAWRTKSIFWSFVSHFLVELTFINGLFYFSKAA
jgi:uncharacterized protein